MTVTVSVEDGVVAPRAVDVTGATVDRPPEAGGSAVGETGDAPQESSKTPDMTVTKIRVPTTAEASRNGSLVEQGSTLNR